MDESRGGSRIVYPKLFPTLTEADLASQFRLAREERAWAGTAARRGPSMVVLLTPAEGISEHRSLPAPCADTGNSPVLHCEATFTGGAHGRFNRPAHDVSAKRAIRTCLGVTPWGASARAVASNAVAAETESIHFLGVCGAQLLDHFAETIARPLPGGYSWAVGARLAPASRNWLRSTPWKWLLSSTRIGAKMS